MPLRNTLLALLVTLCALNACTYHGRVKRGLYPTSTAPARVDASVLVISDRYLPAQLTFAEPETSSLYTFTLDTADGVMVAVTDALSTQIARADAGPHTLENRYDFAADIHLEAQLTRSDCTGRLGAQAVRVPGLCTQLALTLRRADGAEALGTFSARRWGMFHKPGLAAALLWLNEHTFSLLSPVLVPGYTQLQGTSLRRQFEKQLIEMLNEIIQQIQDHQDQYPARWERNN